MKLKNVESYLMKSKPNGSLKKDSIISLLDLRRKPHIFSMITLTLSTIGYVKFMMLKSSTNGFKSLQPSDMIHKYSKTIMNNHTSLCK